MSNLEIFFKILEEPIGLTILIVLSLMLIYFIFIIIWIRIQEKILKIQIKSRENTGEVATNFLYNIITNKLDENRSKKYYKLFCKKLKEAEEC